MTIHPLRTVAYAWCPANPHNFPEHKFVPSHLGNVWNCEECRERIARELERLEALLGRHVER